MPPAFTRGVPVGRGESEYLPCKYSKKPVSHKNGQAPSVTMAPGFARNHRATSPINGGGKGLFDTLRRARRSAGPSPLSLCPKKAAKNCEMRQLRRNRFRAIMLSYRRSMPTPQNRYIPLKQRRKIPSDSRCGSVETCRNACAVLLCTVRECTRNGRCV